MCIVTYLDGDKHLAPTSDNELNSLIQEVRQATGEDWRVGELQREVRRFLRKPRTYSCFTLYHQTQGVEFQIVNFYRPDREGEHLSSINTYNSAGYIAAYLYGVLAGLSSRSDALIGKEGE